MDDTAPGTLAAEDLDCLIALLAEGGRQVIGPVRRDGAIMLDPLPAASALPWGWTTEDRPGHSRLRSRPDGAAFGYAVGPDSAKRWLHPARQTLFKAERGAEGGMAIERPAPPPPLALVGLRACDLAAIHLQDKVLRDGSHADPHYASRRSDLLVVAVQCAESGGACFCASMQCGPRVEQGHDLCLTEITEGQHRFVVEIGSPAGAAIAARLPLSPASPIDAIAPQSAAAAATREQSRALPQEGLRESILAALEGPSWEAIATRCLGCAGCTMVCPTCFCTGVVDLTDLTGAATRERRWDSCFHLDFSYIHGGPVRSSLASRYRQWLTHKLVTWQDQFGSSGCVGCGRCSTWCPAGIDIVAEAMALRPPESP